MELETALIKRFLLHAGNRCRTLSLKTFIQHRKSSSLLKDILGTSSNVRSRRLTWSFPPDQEIPANHVRVLRVQRDDPWECVSPWWLLLHFFFNPDFIWQHSIKSSLKVLLSKKSSQWLRKNFSLVHHQWELCPDAHVGKKWSPIETTILTAQWTETPKGLWCFFGGRGLFSYSSSHPLSVFFLFSFYFIFLVARGE